MAVFSVTEREAVMREREAFSKGVSAVAKAFCLSFMETRPQWEGSLYMAERLYPLHKVKRPRVVADPGGMFEWSIRDGNVCNRTYSHDEDDWFSLFRGGCVVDRFEPTAARVALWADLLANPTEEVEAE